jgi:hypothetical protein
MLYEITGPDDNGHLWIAIRDGESFATIPLGLEEGLRERLGNAFTLTDRQRDVLVIAIDAGMDSFECRISDEEGSELAQGWRADLDALLGVRRQIAGELA